MIETEKLKEILLDFVSFELTNHSSASIGLSVMLFAYLNLLSDFYPSRVPFAFRFSSPESLRHFVIFVILFVINFLIIYIALRLVFYGRLASRILRYDKQVISSRQLLIITVDEVKKTPILRWFSRGLLASTKEF